MYGTIFNLTVKRGHENELLKLMEAGDSPKGMVAWFLMEPDEKKDWILNDTEELHLVNAQLFEIKN